MSYPPESKDIQIHHTGGEWSGVYVDGVLHYVGETESCYQQVFELLGVTVIHSGAFMLGQHERHGAAQTLALVDEYEIERDKLIQRADKMEVEATDLVERAERLRALADGPISSTRSAEAGWGGLQ